MDVTPQSRRRPKLPLGLLAGACFAVAMGCPPTATAEEPAASPALAACQRYAIRYSHEARPDSFVDLRLLEDDLQEETYTAKVGGVSVAAVLSGRGIRQEKKGGPINVRFTCLLESPDKPVFFDTVDDGPRDPVAVCWDRFEASEWAKLTQCLQDSLRRAEADLAQELTRATQQGEQSMDKASAKKTLQPSNTQWGKYRDAECARQQAFAAGRNHPDIGELTCRIHKTAARIADLQFDE